MKQRHPPGSPDGGRGRRAISFYNTVDNIDIYLIFRPQATRGNLTHRNQFPRTGLSRTEQRHDLLRKPTGIGVLREEDRHLAGNRPGPPGVLPASRLAAQENNSGTTRAPASDRGAIVRRKTVPVSATAVPAGRLHRRPFPGAPVRFPRHNPTPPPSSRRYSGTAQAAPDRTSRRSVPANRPCS